MSMYVMSDIHGCYDKFIKMISLIDLKKEDELYILGDVLDRGEEPLKIIDYIITHKNIILLKGNHEKFFENYFESGETFFWHKNGGEVTYRKIIERGQAYEYMLYELIRKLPLVKVIDKFILSHSGLFFPLNYDELSLERLLELQDEDDYLWTRDYINSDIQFKDYKIICGHTPVQSITKNYEDVKILHRKGHIFIDTGCVFENAGGRLSCLRLDDMKEFYI